MNKSIPSPASFAISTITGYFFLGLVSTLIPIVGPIITLCFWGGILFYPFNHQKNYQEYVKSIRKKNEEEEIRQWKHNQNLTLARRRNKRKV